MNRHISGQYDSELESVRLGFMDMGGRVERQVQTATRAFVTHDAESAATVREGEEEINQLERVLDDRCIHIIARRQPTAGDLRLLITIMKGCIDLERIGDEAEKIARMASKISHLPLPSDQYADVQRMRELVIRMVANTLDAFARLDLESARSVISADGEVDRMFRNIDESLSQGLHMHADSVMQSLNTIWTARALERIGDHAKNICEHTVYLIEGTDVRHLDRGDGGTRE
ncbi:MAG: phosphate signaling complex protein PhoU [Gammaproteobacteria bacterium]|nr:phosphate signaling complex protein PhoU [Gammaproteobacteria bacterium]